jgi:hypothetical protein
MAKSTGIVLTAVGIGMGNEFIQGHGVNFRMGIAGLGAALFLSGVEKLNQTAAVGISVLLLITVFVTPFKGRRGPAQEILFLINSKSKTPAGATPAPPTFHGGIA